MLPAALVIVVPLLAAATPHVSMRLDLDAREAPRRILHGRLVIPASAGPLTLLYPKWIPGEHAPAGPIGDLVGLRVTAAGRIVPWRRDAEEMHAFHLDIPAGAREVEATFDFLLAASPTGFTAGASTTNELAVLSWNQSVLYPRGLSARQVTVTARLTLPSGWRFGTALPVARQSGATVDFKPVSLETLVDSPVLAGRHFKKVELAKAHTLHLAADSETAIAVDEAVLAPYRRLIGEAAALFGAQHYDEYHFLLSLSDRIAHFGLEHHQSSDNRRPERVFLEDGLRVVHAGLLPHEFVHSWNGKYRRPADLTTPDYDKPMHTGLLWVYEGLTTYLGEVLTARSGLRGAIDAREALALTAASMDVAPGRTWRSLADTAVAAQVLFGSPRGWRAWRRGVDFYPESQLIWLEADTVIRAKTGGRKSLDDFCRAFHGGASGPPTVKPYTRRDVMTTLAEITPHDWEGFFAARIDVPTSRAPLGGIEASGWRLVYREQPTGFFKSLENARKEIDLSFSLGLVVDEEGGIIDVIPDAPAAKAGIGPGMRILAVNGRRFSRTVVGDAAAATKRKPDLDLLVENGDFIRPHSVRYRGGARFPALERDERRPDLLGAILAPRAH